MRSKHDNVTFLETLSARVPHVERASHPEYPLERVCAHPRERFQLSFARNAQQHFVAREDVEVVASHRGLVICAETEEAIDAAIVVLRHFYGAELRVGPATIRYHRGVVVEQPWMGLRVHCASAQLDAVNADLLDRHATIVSCDIGPAQCLVEARAPLAKLLGYRADLEKLTGGAARLTLWLSHYAPLEEPPPPDGRAA